jgi:single-strand DNA-binding protein
MKNVKTNKTKKKTKKKTPKKTGKTREIEGVNEVFLVGRVTSIAGEKKLPSGDIVSEFRVVVERQGKTGKGGAIDTIDIAVWKSVLRKRSHLLNRIIGLKLRGVSEGDSGRAQPE